MKKKFTVAARSKQMQGITRPDEAIVYLEQGVLHRDGGPAVLHPHGAEEWYKNGMLHRDNGPAYRDPSKTEIKWYQNGVLHREDGPAVINGPHQYWFQQGRLHRTDGPAVCNDEGEQYWYRGLQYPDMPALTRKASSHEPMTLCSSTVFNISKFRPK